MFDTTFFKFLIAFLLIIGISFLAMNIAGGAHTATGAGSENTQAAGQ